MPSPFPGMDPYLEGSTWMNFHGQLCSEIRAAVGPEAAATLSGEIDRAFLHGDHRRGRAVEGLEVSRHRRRRGQARIAAERSRGTRSGYGPRSHTHRNPRASPPLLGGDPRPTRASADHGDRSPFADQQARRGTRRISGETQSVLQSPSHLIEVNLFRAGRRIPMTRDLPSAPYYVYVGRSEIRPETDVWPILLDQPLPTIPVPLLPGDADVPLDLQLA